MPFASAKILSVTSPALGEEHHYALEEPAVPPKGSLVVSSGNSVRPIHLFGYHCDHDYCFGLPAGRGAECTINITAQPQDHGSLIEAPRHHGGGGA